MSPEYRQSYARDCSARLSMKSLAKTMKDTETSKRKI